MCPGAIVHEPSVPAEEGELPLGGLPPIESYISIDDLPPVISTLFGFRCLKWPPSNTRSRCEAFSAGVEPCIQVLQERIEATKGTGWRVRHQRWQVEVLQALLYLHNGYEAEAVASFGYAYQTALRLNEELAAVTLRELGVAQLRWGERTNCVQNHNAATCVLPIRARGRHAVPEGSLAAVQSFSEYLEEHPHDQNIIWLLNLAYMTLGQHPERVPQRFLIDESFFLSAVPQTHFENIAPSLGLHADGLVGGVIVDDFTGNGYLDLVASSIGECDPIRFYENDGKGGFTEKTDVSGLGQILGVGHMVQADFNNDGHLDIYATRGIWEFPGIVELGIPYAGHNVLLKNRGDGTFEDVTAKVGLKTAPKFNVASVWGDYTNNGYVDLFVCGGAGTGYYLYRNEGGHFRDVSRDAGFEPMRPEDNCMGAAWGDVNNNGWLDLFVSNHGGKNALYLNQKDGTFLKADIPVLEGVRNSFPVWFWDYDNDGNLDLFVGAWEGDYSSIPQVIRGRQPRGGTAKLFRNLGDGRFVDVTQDVGLSDIILVMGANFGDLNNNGFLDMYVGTGGPSFIGLTPNRMLRNEDGEGFVDVTYAGGFGNIQKGHGIGFGDLNNDGYPEIFASFGGWYAGDRFVDSLYLNPGGSNRWLVLRLEATRGNRSAIGARVTAHIREGRATRTVHRVVTSGGSFGSGSLQVQLGLGGAEQVERLEIRWPSDSELTVFENVASNQILDIREGEPKYRVRSVPAFSFPHPTSHSRHAHE
jgi:hypothetical protein